MELLDELRICIMALDSLKTSYLEYSLKNKSTTNSIDLITGQYIAYASCYSILMDLVEKHENSEGI